jgi:hypothetical protein
LTQHNARTGRFSGGNQCGLCVICANPPVKRGQRVEKIVLPEPEATSERPLLTAADLLASGLGDLWEGREDIVDSPAFARQLRDQAQHRGDQYRLFDDAGQFTSDNAGEQGRL